MLGLRLLGVALLAQGCATAPATPVPTPIPEPVRVPLPEAPAERAMALRPLGEAPFLWRVRCPDRPGWGFILGSVHVRKKGSPPLPSAVTTVIDTVDTVAFEAKVPGPLGAIYQMYKLGAFRFLTRTELDDATWTALETRLAPMKMKRRNMRYLAPWALFFMVMGVDLQASDMDPELGIDHLVQARAQAATPPKPLLYMETAESQIRLFADLPEAEQIQMLKEALQSEPVTGDDVVDMYEAGDAAGLEAQVLDSFEGHPELRRQILDLRNRNFEAFAWSLYDKPGVSLIVAGAAHMVGDVGLPRLLETRGCAVERGSKPEGHAAVEAATEHTAPDLEP